LVNFNDEHEAKFFRNFFQVSPKRGKKSILKLIHFSNYYEINQQPLSISSKDAP